MAIWWTLAVAISAAPAADATAESLFREAIGMMEAGRFEEACPKLAASQELDPRSGTMISLAFCHRHLGRTATAWAEYNAAASLAQTEGRAEYLDKARLLAAALEPELCRLRLRWSSAGPPPTVMLDGRQVPVGQLGAAVALDPGAHEVQANRDGHRPWSRQVDVTPGCGVIDVSIPQLAPAAVVVAGAAEADGSPAWAYAAIGVGAAAVVAGAVLGGLVLDRQSVIDDECDQAAMTCSQAGLDAVDEARPMAIATNALFAVGAVAVGVGVFFSF